MNRHSSIEGGARNDERKQPAGDARHLKINWIMPATNLAGGIKSNLMIAEAMVRRCHEVNIAFVALPKSWPKIRQFRRWLRRIGHEFAIHGRRRHHLTRSTANLIPVMACVIRPEHVPDADVSIATWWETREWIEDWPASKGVKAYFVRGHELHGGDPQRVKDTYRMTGLKFVISSWLRSVMAEKYSDHNAILVPNGIDRKQFDSPIRGRQTLPTVGFLYGRQEIKGAVTAFNALRRVREQYPELRAIAFGSSPLLRKHDPPSWLEFHLRPWQDEIPHLYQQADCWIVPSTTEGFGMPGLEAAACHCPIVSTLCGGPEDYLEEGVSGFLVPIGDSVAIADAVCRVLDLPDDQWRKMSQASYKISQRFDWDQSAKILETTLLHAVVSRNSVDPRQHGQNV